MNKGKTIDELQPGDELKGDVFVVSCVDEVNAKGYRFLTMSLSDATGVCKATFFKPDLPCALDLYHARLLRVYGCVQTAQKYRGQIKVESFEIVSEVDDLTPFVPPLPAEYKIHQRRFSAILKSVQEPKLLKLLEKVFQSEGTWLRFKRAVAAQGKHHTYPGGLLEHSTEVAELCDQACRVLPGLHRDFLVTCALLHDIGKLDEMEHDLGVGRYTESGTLVGHVFSGAYLIRTAADGIADFPAVLKDAIVHLILSHHGRPEYGAARVPARAEAHVLAQCDMMSARINECCRAVSQAGLSTLKGVFSARLSGGEHLHIGDLGLQDIVGEALRAENEDAPQQTLTPTFNTSPSTQLGIALIAVEPEPASPVFRTKSVLPVRGRVAAGSPGMSSTEEDETREVVLPAGGADYLLHVTGSSMIGVGILDGDLLFVRSEGPWKGEDIVVAHLPGEGEVVKRLRQNIAGEPPCLISENPDPAYQPIPLEEGARIQGKVTGLLRDV